MVQLKRHRVGDKSSVQLYAPEDTLLFDYPAVLYGTNHAKPDFQRPPKDVLLKYKRIEHADALFITTSDSIGCMVADVPVIYCTRPVIDQIMILYYNLLALSVTYDEEDTGDYSTVPLSSVDVSAFRSKLVFVNNYQMIRLKSFAVTVQPAGTFIGWVNYKLEFANNESLVYLASYSSKQRFSTTAGSLSGSSVLVNRQYAETPGDMARLSRLLQDFCAAKSTLFEECATLLVPVPIHFLLSELLLHILSIVESSGIDVYVISPLFQKVYTSSNAHCEWLNKKFLSIDEPFPLKSYGPLSNFSHFNDQHPNNHYRPGKKIVLCDITEFACHPGRIFPDQHVLLINSSLRVPGATRLAIKMQDTDDELRAIPNIKNVMGISEDGLAYIPSEPARGEDTYRISVPANVACVDKQLWLSGVLSYTDADGLGCYHRALEPGASLFRRLVETGEYVVVGDEWIFYSRRIRARLLDDKLLITLY